MDEFGLIAAFFQRAPKRPEVLLGVGDDAALIAVSAPGDAHVLTTDTLVAGVHFPTDAPGFDVGYKALAVNVSDLAAMGARPIGLLLNLTLPTLDERWLAGFRDGLFSLADSLSMDLIGGDTVRGPLSVTITALGVVPAAQALRRGGARVGDQVYVSGFLGDAALGFLVRAGQVSLPEALCAQPLGRLDRPQPRIIEGQALRSIASAAIDISDGLVADLGHILAASGVGAELDLRRLPLSDAYKAAWGAIGYDPALSFGDDYELCFTVPAQHLEAFGQIAPRFACGFHYLGDIVAGSSLMLRSDGGVYTPASQGFNHFHA
ncbi:MAG: thiamine-phosphate kinase [Acidiferrobacter sp.]